jgi:hypothetical protein
MMGLETSYQNPPPILPPDLSELLRRNGSAFSLVPDVLATRLKESKEYLKLTDGEIKKFAPKYRCLTTISYRHQYVEAICCQETPRILFKYF